jgi:O-antigen/teichoic acid export membrane protein
MVLSQISLFFVTPKYGLIIGMLFGNLLALFMGFFIYLKQVGFKLKKISLRLSKILLLNLSDFPKYSVWGTFLNALSLSSVILLMGLFFSESIVGSFFLTYRLLQFPLALIGQAIGITFFQEFSNHIRRKDLKSAKNLFYSLEKKLALIGVLPFAVLTVFGDKILIWLLGERWHIVGIYAKYLTPWLYLVFIYSPLSNVYNSLRKQKIFLLSQILFISSRVSAVIIGGYFLKDDILTVLLLGIVGAFLVFSLQTYTHTFILKLKFTDLLRITIVYPLAVLFLILIKISL